MKIHCMNNFTLLHPLIFPDLHYYLAMIAAVDVQPTLCSPKTPYFGNLLITTASVGIRLLSPNFIFAGAGPISPGAPW